MFARSLKRSTYLILLTALVAYIAAVCRSRSFRPRQFTSAPPPQPEALPPHYSTSVAFQPKNRGENRLMQKYNKSPQMESPSGEDNYFVALNGEKLVVGVADGVGGWAELGYDSSAISREICHSIARDFEMEGTDLPKELLGRAFSKVQKDGIVKVGGTTACLGVFDAHKLTVANLGDSWCGVFRNCTLIAETKVQTHGFNTPYQLAIIPAEIKEKNKGSNFIMDSPTDADVYEFAVEKDDIVMFATDGVIDNIDVKDIELYLHDNQNEPLDRLSKDFVQKVSTLSKDEDFPSVFSQELSKLTGQFYSGGKEDDITVVMVKVQC